MPPPPFHLLLLIILLALYLGLAYLTKATQGFYTYSLYVSTGVLLPLCSRYHIRIRIPRPSDQPQLLQPVWRNAET